MTATTTEEKPKDTRGLAGQAVGDTGICQVGQTSLIYRGYEIADLAENASFEEVAHLLIVGHRPNPGELQAFKAELASMRPIPDGLKSLLRDIAGDPPDTRRRPVADHDGLVGRGAGVACGIEGQAAAAPPVRALPGRLRRGH